MTRRHLLLAVFPIMLLASPVVAQNFHLDWDRDVKFSKYHTYVWAPRSTQQAATSPDYARVLASIDRYLASRGFTKGAAGDFAVGFTAVGASKEYEGSYGAGSTVGSLSIDIYDTATKRPIWNAAVSMNVSSQLSQQQLDRAVQRLLDRFPPSHGCSHNPAETLINPCPRD